MSMEERQISKDAATPETAAISKGLIIAQPWIGKILRGEKIWEMRSSSTLIRGSVALIEKGTGTIVGVANVLNSVGPLSFDEIFNNEEKHCVGAEIYTQDDYKWNHAWLLGQVTPLLEPVRYKHKSGAVIWVELDDLARTQLKRQLNKNASAPAKEIPHGDGDPIKAIVPEIGSLVPFARDGSCFCKEACSRNGYYTVGEKGFEQRIGNYQSALNYLSRMPTAKWRRPNPKGNWGIVSAVRWAPPQ